MRELGLTEDHSEGAPICRWRRDDIIIDVMPTDERILGFSNRWYMPALASSQPMEIAELGLRVVTAVYFLAMKLEAFHGRGDDDVMGSYDLEDLITVIDGRPQIIDELRVAAPDVRSYVASNYTSCSAGATSSTLSRDSSFRTSQAREEGRFFATG